MFFNYLYFINILFFFSNTNIFLGSFLQKNLYIFKNNSIKNENNFLISDLNNLFFMLSFLIITISIYLLKELKKKNKYKIFFYSIIIPLYYMIKTNNIFIFFFFYEVLLIISAILIYYFSPNIRSKTITVYFVLWTQLGSFLVLLGICIIYKQTGFYNFNQLINYKFNLITQLLFFFGFGIKIPVWPFSFWITKAHVEVNTSFSIFLSSILVKIAIIGFQQFNDIFDFNYNFIFYTFIIISILDSSIKLINQTDFKKTIAYLTIQEMNILLFFLTTQNYQSGYLIYFLFETHVILTLILFYINDLIYKRYNTR